MKVLYSLLETAILSENGSDKAAFWTACYHEHRDILAQKLWSNYRHLNYNESFDFIQDAFEKLWGDDIKSFEKYFQNGDKMGGLLWTATKNIYINHLKVKKNVKPDSLDDGITCYQPTYELPYDGDIARLLNQISKEDAKILRLVWNGYEQKEIADMEGVKLSAMKMRIKRAREKLQNAFLADS